MGSRLRVLARVVMLCLLTAAVAGSGCRTVRERAEDSLRQALPQLVGPAAEYRVSIDGSSRDLRHGRADRVRVIGRQVRARGLPALAELQLDVHDLIIDLERGVVVSAGAASLVASLDDAELSRLLNDRVRAWRRKRVRSRLGFVRVEGWIEAGSLVLRGSSDYALSVRDGVEIWATPTRVAFQGAQAGVPARVRTRAAAVLNPVYTLAEDPLRIRLRRAEPLEGRVRLVGTFDPTGLQLATDRASG